MPKENHPQQPIINAHTHVFTKNHTPKYLARKIIPWPFYRWLETGPMLRVIKWYLDRDRVEYTYQGRNDKWAAYKRKKFWTQTPIINAFYFLFKAIVWIIFAYYLLDLIQGYIEESWILGWIYNKLFPWMEKFMPDLAGAWSKIFLLVLLLLIFSSVRKTLKNYIWMRIKKAVGDERLEFLLRYINIVRFTGKEQQARIFNDLKQQYPVNSQFVILPMDMEFMGAGTVETSYEDQMEEVLRLRNNNPDSCLPFIFIHPKRIQNQDPNNPFLKINTDKPSELILEDCLVKKYLDNGCVGIKIYPAMGYYVFDKNLLELWLYCAQNNIPITTHCSVGPIFFRGNLKDLGKDYFLHPIFKEVYETNSNREDIIKPLRLDQLKNKDFQKNFTHPLNYLCLIHKPLLIKLIEAFDEGNDLKDLFGYKEGDIERDLSNLKINLAHYGGADQWERFMKKDRYKQSNYIIHKVNGLELKEKIDRLGSFYIFWHHVDWFSIISSMMIEYDQVYSDISYTTHETHLLNVLSEFLENEKLGRRILFGTDFYVVSNHKTDKEYWMDMKHHLGDEKWRKMAFENPKEFLNLS